MHYEKRLVGCAHILCLLSHTEYSDDESPKISLQCFCPHNFKANLKKLGLKSGLNTLSLLNFVDTYSAMFSQVSLAIISLEV